MIPTPEQVAAAQMFLPGGTPTYHARLATLLATRECAAFERGFVEATERKRLTNVES